MKALIKVPSSALFTHSICMSMTDNFRSSASSRVIGDKAILPIPSVRHHFKHRPQYAVRVRYVYVCERTPRAWVLDNCFYLRQPLPTTAPNVLGAMVGNGRQEYCYNVVCGYSRRPLRPSLSNPFKCLSLQLHRRGFCILVLDLY